MFLKRSNKQIGYVVFILLIFFQVIALIHMGYKKEGMHIDEFYSFILSNSYDNPTISMDTLKWNNWLAGTAFQEFLSVENGEQFSYGSVYFNNSLDAHPPLFYFLLHSVCSFFPGQYTAWFGIALNILIIVSAQIILFFFAKEIMGNTLWSCVPVALYGGTQAFFDTTIFIRMYSLLTLFTILLAWQHYRLMKQPNKRLTIFWCFLFTFLGAFTQYYFLFIAFFLAIAACVFLLFNRKWSIFFLYAGAMLFAVVCVFVFYPAGITQITGSDTNNVGNAVMANLFNFSGWLRACYSMVRQAFDLMISGFVNNLWLTFVLVVLTVTFSCVFRKKNKESGQKNSFKIWIKEIAPSAVLLATVLATILLISHISAQFIFVRYIYNLFPLITLGLTVILHTTLKYVRLDATIVASGILVTCLIGTTSIVANNKCSYLFSERAASDNQIIQMYNDRPLVLINNGSTYQPTGLLHFILEARQVYLVDYNEFNDVDNCFSQVNCEEGVVFIVLTDKVWSEGYDGKEVMNQIVNDSSFFDAYEQIGTCSFSTVFLATPEM